MFRLTPYHRSNVVTTNNEFDNFYSLLDDVFNESFYTTPSLSNGHFKVDIKDSGDAFVLEAELPGVAKDAISIDYKDNQLAIKVSKAEGKDEEKSNYIYKERRQSVLQRVFRMKGVKREDMSAKLENGILTVIAPKLDEVVNTYKVEIE